MDVVVVVAVACVSGGIVGVGVGVVVVIGDVVAVVVHGNHVSDLFVDTFSVLHHPWRNPSGISRKSRWDFLRLFSWETSNGEIPLGFPDGRLKAERMHMNRSLT